MGFDIYGIEPKENTVRPKILRQDWTKLDDGAKDKYWETHTEWEKENPGVYFRNNVWWWRPLWSYVCNVCEDVMTEEEIDAGGDNSGSKISESTAQRMVDKLRIEIALENHTKHQKEYMKYLKSLPLKECTVCEGTGTRKWKDGEKDCNVCNTENTKKEEIPVGKVKAFACSYPFDAKNLEEFTVFLEQSGGIQVC